MQIAKFFTAKYRQRLGYLLLFMLILALGCGLLLYALKQNINLFFTPSQALAQHLPLGQNFRLGGQVKPGSVIRDQESLTVHFVLTDLVQEIAVTYTGVLPDLFREGKGAIAEGLWQVQGSRTVFAAHEILAKHDENYKPRAMQGIPNAPSVSHPSKISGVTL
jgi:cytochrome c-type biogenesis protein CcmE